MITVQIIQGQQVHHLQAERGVLLSDLLRLHGSANLPCGGRGICRRCRVQAEGALSAPTKLECAHLTSAELELGWRLACMTHAEGDVTIRPAAEIYNHIRADGTMQPFDPAPVYRHYGVAVDIGTTTVCVQLYGAGGLLLGTASGKNPQTRYGADVISRIEYALAGGSEELAACIRADIAQKVEALGKQAGIQTNKIDAFAITGNTTMLYLLTGQNPEPLSHAPFGADRLFGEHLAATELLPKLQLGPQARVFLPRCVSAFVGADFTTAALASGIYNTAKTCLLVDIGTNGEMGLWHNGRLTVCSTAAGPAFEGVGLRCGVYGVQGAIDHVWTENNALRISTIGDAAPVGVCGSGIVDALGVMLACKALDESGFMEGDFSLTDGIFITLQDIRQLQLAKSAIRAGMETLLHTASLGWEAVDTLLIAGGFGSYLNLDSAASIGLIPQGLQARTTVLGNTALAGASMLLLHKAFADETQHLAKQAQSLALNSNPYFMEQYIEHMLFSSNA